MCPFLFALSWDTTEESLTILWTPSIHEGCVPTCVLRSYSCAVSWVLPYSFKNRDFCFLNWGTISIFFTLKAQEPEGWWGLDQSDFQTCALPCRTCCLPHWQLSSVRRCTPMAPCHYHTIALSKWFLFYLPMCTKSSAWRNVTCCRGEKGEFAFLAHAETLVSSTPFLFVFMSYALL